MGLQFANKNRKWLHILIVKKKKNQQESYQIIFNDKIAFLKHSKNPSYGNIE